MKHEPRTWGVRMAQTAEESPGGAKSGISFRSKSAASNSAKERRNLDLSASRLLLPTQVRRVQLGHERPER